jgi:hypothetical protein
VIEDDGVRVVGVKARAPRAEGEKRQLKIVALTRQALGDVVAVAV